MGSLDLDKANILIHIGCHKTASSWLQNNVFDNPALGFRALALENRNGQTAKNRLRSVARQLVLTNGARQYPGPFHTPKPAFGMAFSGVRFSPEATYVMSDERLSGNPHSGGFDRVELCLKLKEVLPSARILMVFRAQETMIRSCYHQYIVAGGSLSLAGYMRMSYRFIVPTFSLEYFRYDKLLSLYIEHFGAKNVLALPYEQFLSEPENFISRIRNHAGQAGDTSELMYNKIDNHRANPWLLVKLRHLNRWRRQVDFAALSQARRSPAFKFSHGVPGKYLKTQFLLSRQRAKDLAFIRREIKGVYAQSNQTLQTLSGCELARYGYELP